MNDNNAKSPGYEVVAKAIRMEHDPDTNKVFLVFEIVEENFKNRIKASWAQDIELKLLGRNLVLNEGE